MDPLRFARFALLSVLLLIITVPNHALAQSAAFYPELLCDSDYVFGDDNSLVIFVQPTHADDTANIQCALEEATRMGVPTIQLISADYYISAVSIADFTGTLQGTSKNETVINVLDGSVDCSAFIDVNRAPAVIKFIGGEPRIRYLKLVAGQACNDEWDMTALLHFTGAAASDSQCGNDVVFGVVDRIILDGTDRDTGPHIGISAQAEGYQLHPLLPNACNRNLLGTFRVNRSELYNTQFGIATTMRSNAQVDINFNTFQGHDGAVWIENANQNTSITKNTFLGHSAISNYHGGVVQTVYLEAGDTPPKASRIVIHDNRFDLLPFDQEQIYGVLLSGREETDISAAMTQNRIHLTSNVYAGIATSDLSNGNISANSFWGNEADQFFVQALILGDGGTSTTTGWTVSGNDIAKFAATFTASTSGNYFGPGQAAGIDDAGSGNIVIEDGNYPLIIDLQNRDTLTTGAGDNGSKSQRPNSAAAGPVIARSSTITPH